MTVLDQLRKVRGKIPLNARVMVIAVPNGYSFGSTSVYKSTSNSDPFFFLSSGIIGGKHTAFLSSDADSTMESAYESMHGIMYFITKGKGKIISLAQSNQNLNLKLELTNINIEDLYAGLPYKLSKSPPLNIVSRDTSKTGSQLRPSYIKHSKNYQMNPISYKATTAAGTISIGADYIDLSGYTSSDSTTNIPAQGFLQIINTAGTISEWCRYDFYDTVTQKITLERRGALGDTAKTWSGSFDVFIWNPAHPDNFTLLKNISGLESGLDFYLVPEPHEAYPKPQLTLALLYDSSNYYNKTKVYHPNTTLEMFDYSTIAVPWALFCRDEYPAALTTNMSSFSNKITNKGNNSKVSDIFFTTPYEADQGFLYNYCGTNEYCGSCMGDTKDSKNKCFVTSDAWFKVQKGEEGIAEAESYDKNDEWNKLNTAQNYYVPWVLMVFFAVITLLFMLIYGGLLGKFINLLKTDPYVDTKFDNWTAESITIKHTGITCGVLVGLILVSVIPLIVIASIRDPKDNNARIFPITNYDRSVYNPPPGYTFVNSPSNDSGPIP